MLPVQYCPRFTMQDRSMIPSPIYVRVLARTGVHLLLEGQGECSATLFVTDCHSWGSNLLYYRESTQRVNVITTRLLPKNPKNGTRWLILFSGGRLQVAERGRQRLCVTMLGDASASLVLWTMLSLPFLYFMYNFLAFFIRLRQRAKHIMKFPGVDPHPLWGHLHLVSKMVNNQFRERPTS